MDPVPTRQGTLTPHMVTSTCGQDDTSFPVSSESFKEVTEPMTAPPELWLRNLVGASFPPADQSKAVCAAVVQAGCGAQHAPHRTHGQNDQAADTCDR